MTYNEIVPMLAGSGNKAGRPSFDGGFISQNRNGVLVNQDNQWFVPTEADMIATDWELLDRLPEHLEHKHPEQHPDQHLEQHPDQHPEHKHKWKKRKK